MQTGAGPEQAVGAALGSVGFSLKVRESSWGVVSRLVKPKYRGLIWTHLFLKNRFRTNHKRVLDPWILDFANAVSAHPQFEEGNQATEKAVLRQTVAVKAPGNCPGRHTGKGTEVDHFGDRKGAFSSLDRFSMQPTQSLALSMTAGWYQLLRETLLS